MPEANAWRTPKALRKTGIGRGVPLSSRLEDLGARRKLPNLNLGPEQSPKSRYGVMK